MNIKTLDKIIDLKIRIYDLEENDEERKSIVESGSYAIAEGYETPNMLLINKLEEELEKLYEQL